MFWDTCSNEGLNACEVTIPERFTRDSHYNHQKPVFQDTNTVSDSLDGMWQSLHETVTEATVPGEISLFLMESGKPS